MIRVYTPAEARAAGVFIEGYEPPPSPAVEESAPDEPPVRCMSCARPLAGQAGFAIGRMFTDANGVRWDTPCWTCRHNETLPRQHLICWDCVTARRHKPCPECGCSDEYT